MARGTGDAKIFTGLSATTAPFTLYGGQYAVLVIASAWASGSVTLQMLGADGSTWLAALTAFSANGYGTVSLPPGRFRVAVTSATGVSISIARILTD